MDANASHALRIAAGIVIAVMIISVLVYLFNNLQPFQQNLDDIKATEQTTEFNKTFLAYDKDLMYGADIISVLNKAASINQSYIDQYGYSVDLQNNYLINILFEGNPIVISQSVELYKVELSATGKPEERGGYNFSSLDNITKNSIANKWNVPVGEISNGTRTISPPIALIDSGATGAAIEKKGRYINQIIYNTIIKPSSTELKKIATNNDTDTMNVWSKVIFERYAYGFKTKKFRCTNIDYSNQTSRIISMTFREVN